MKVKVGARVMYNGDAFTVSGVERNNGRAVAVWCRNASDEEFYLDVDVLEDVNIDEEIISASSEICEHIKADCRNYAHTKCIVEYPADDSICSDDSLFEVMETDISNVVQSNLSFCEESGYELR